MVIANWKHQVEADLLLMLPYRHAAQALSSAPLTLSASARDT